jgi:hypothetical protein
MRILPANSVGRGRDNTMPLTSFDLFRVPPQSALNLTLPYLPAH